MNKKDLFELAAEIHSIGMIIAGLGNQLDNEKTDTLTSASMQEALYGIREYLERISDDLLVIDKKS